MNTSVFSYPGPTLGAFFLAAYPNAVEHTVGRYRSDLSLEFVRQPFARSSATTTVTHLRELPPPRADDTYSFDQILSLLSDEGRAIFEEESHSIDAQLRERLDRGEISKIYFWRCRARMTQEQLAKMAESHQSYLSQIEQGKRPLTWKQASKFASVLGVAPEQLMENDELGD